MFSSLHFLTKIAKVDSFMKKPALPKPSAPKEQAQPDLSATEEVGLSKLVDQDREIIWSSRSQQRALGIFALLAVAGIVWLAKSVWIGLLLGTLIAFSIEPIYQRLRRRWKRAELAALFCV